MRAAFADIDGTRIRFLHEGSGYPLLLLQGVGLSADIFIRNIDILSRHYRVIVPDFPGHGFSDAIDFHGDPPPIAIAQCLTRFADRLQLSQYSVAGSSFGGLVGSLMWFNRPAQVERLIIIGSGSVFHPADEQEKTLHAVMQNGVSAMSNPTLDTCRLRMQRLCYAASSVAEEILPLQLTSYALADRLAAYRKTIDGMLATVGSFEARVIDRLETLAAETLVMVGRDDVRARWDLHEQGCRRMPHARCVILEQCGHLPYMEHPETFNQLVIDFLGSR
jgi:2-hydroxy-6-oxonona-2,4-dienedioate hydrolase